MSTPSSSSRLRNWPCIFVSLHDFTSSSSTASFLYYSGFTGASTSTIIMVWSSPVIFQGILSHVSAVIPQFRDITLSARYGQYQGWLTTVRFQKYLVDLTFHTRRPLHSPRQLQMHQSWWVLLSLYSWPVDSFNFESKVLINFPLFLLSLNDLLLLLLLLLL